MEDPPIVISLEYLEEMMKPNNDKRGYEVLYPLLRVMSGVCHG